MSRSMAAGRIAVAAAFFSQGFIFISLTTRLPAIAQTWSLSATSQSLVLLAMVLLAGAGSLLSEKLTDRFDSAALLRAGLLGTVLAIPFAATAGSFAVFCASMALYGLSLGAVDATSNMQAVAVEHRFGRVILPSFHGAWTLGGLLAASITLAQGNSSLAVLAAMALVPLLVCLAPFPRRATVTSLGAVDVGWRPLLLVGTAMVLFYMVDTAAQTWGPTYLDRVFDTPSQLVALATFPYLLASLLLRLAGDGLVARFGEVRLIRVGAVLAAAALAMVVAAPGWPLAVAGFTLLGAAVASVAPLSYSAAARIAAVDQHGVEISDPVQRTQRVDAVIARFNQFNYLGALIGAVLTGLVGAGDLRFGFALPLILVLALIPLAPAFSPGGHKSLDPRSQ